MNNCFLELRNITKHFGTILAIGNINFKVGNNEIIGLIGDNGAGKSTLIKIISGLYPPDSGKIFLNGKELNKWGIKEARNAGIETVYQDKALADQQSLESNIFMGREISNFIGYINFKKQRIETEKLMREMGFTSSLLIPESKVLTCSGGEREGVAISRAIFFKANLVILDEPTTALSILETKKVFDFVQRIKERGSSCIFITHNIYHVYDIAERFAIMDRGEISASINKSTITLDELINKMTNIAKSRL